MAPTSHPSIHPSQFRVAYYYYYYLMNKTKGTLWSLAALWTECPKMFIYLPLLSTCPPFFWCCCCRWKTTISWLISDKRWSSSIFPWSLVGRDEKTATGDEWFHLVPIKLCVPEIVEPTSIEHYTVSHHSPSNLFINNIKKRGNAEAESVYNAPQ